MIIVLTGNPGVGKHTVAEKITKKLKMELLDINEIVKNSELFEKNDDAIDVDVEELEKIIHNKINNPMLIVGHLAPYVIPEEKVDKTIVLRKNPYDLYDIYKKRQYTRKKSRQNIECEVLGITAYDSLRKFGKKVFQIDTTRRDVDKVTELVLDIMKGSSHNDEVDWLDMIWREKDLEKIFSDWLNNVFLYGV